MSDYESLGLRPIINAYATVTKYGGSLMPPAVLRAMQGAAGSFVDLASLQSRVGQRIAVLTRNESATVTAGAAAGIVLASAAAVLHKTPDALEHFPAIRAFPHEAVLFREQRNPYDHGIHQAGLRRVEVEGSADALRAAITEKSACVYWFPRGEARAGTLCLADVIAIAGDYDLPVIVDAAAQLPPVENLWRFTQMGAALALFSGGKDLRGPQATGLMLGRRDFIESIRPISNPLHGLGRPFKVSKEELLGLLAALERYLRLDHKARAMYCEDAVRLFCAALEPLPGVEAQRDFPNEAGQPLAWCRVRIRSEVLGKSADDIVEELLQHEPAIAVSPLDAQHFHINPMTLRAGQERIVRDACLQLLAPAQ